MDVSGSLTGMAVIGMQVTQQIQATQAQVVASALEGAKQIASTPPAPAARPGGVDIRV
ncbi:hypothetical protein [Azospirillum sp. sgz301742]